MDAFSFKTPPPELGAPTVAVVFTQPACNMHCTFCITESNFDVMTPEEGRAMLDHLASIGVRSVILGGGEPFDWPHDLPALAAYAKQRGFQTVQVGTNGIDVPEGFEHIEDIDRYVIPIESVDPDPHNRMRLYRNRHHGIVLDRLAALKRARKSVTLSTVITSVNRDHVTDLAEWIRRYHEGTEHVHAWHLYQLIPQGRGGAVHGAALHVPPDDYTAIVAAVKAMDLPFSVFRRSDMYHSRTVDFFWWKDGAIRRGAEETLQEQTGAVV
jgi:MoaA/NifB/PqqE/SkfB family radical SAM enzyme